MELLRQVFAAQTIIQKQNAIQKWWYTEGSDCFLDWLKKYHRNHKNELFEWGEPYMEELAIAFGNPWITRLLVKKAAQMGFTELLVGFCGFSIAIVRASAYFCVEEKLKLMDIVSPRFQPSFDYNQYIQKLRQDSKERRGRIDTDTKQRIIEVGGVPVYFGFAGKSGKDKNGRQVSSSLSSVPVEGAIAADEIEGYPPGAIDILLERTEASPLPTVPMRCGSTPGAKGGILDIELENSKYYFDWWIECPHCGTGQFLHPFGNLFLPRQVKEGDRVVERYIDHRGRPYDWHCHTSSQNQEERLKTSYIGCRHCREELKFEEIAKGKYLCHKTREPLREFSDRIFKQRTPVSESVAITMPRLASRRFKAENRIARVLSSRNLADQWQQGFGIIVSLGTGNIDLERILECVGLQVPNRTEVPDLVVVGVDQGQANHFAVVTHWFFDEQAAEDLQKLRAIGNPNPDPENVERDRKSDLWATAHVELAWYGEVYGCEGIEEVAQRWQADLLGMDINPETSLGRYFALKYHPSRECDLGIVASLARGEELRKQKGDAAYFNRYGIAFCCAQVELDFESFKFKKKDVQGEDTPMCSIDRTTWLDAVQDRIYQARLHLPADLRDSYLDKNGFLYHLITSERFIKGRRSFWQEPPGEPDHYLHCLAFAEVAGYVYKFVPQPNPFVFGSV